MTTRSSIVSVVSPQLLASESEAGSQSDSGIDEAIRVCARLRMTFAKLAGDAGFTGFLSRSLALAKTEAPCLGGMQIQTDGTIVRGEGLRSLGPDAESANAGLILISHLLKLLVVFIGEALTLTLLLDAWPDASFETMNMQPEDKS